MTFDILDRGFVFERPTEGDDGGYSDGGQPPEKKPLPPPPPDTSGQYNGPNGGGYTGGYDGAISGAADTLAGGGDSSGGGGQGADEPPPDNSSVNGPNGGGYTPPEAQAGGSGADEPPPSYGDTNGPNGEGYSPPAAQTPSYAHDTNGSDANGGPNGYGIPGQDSSQPAADEPPPGPSYAHDTNGTEGPTSQDASSAPQDFGATTTPFSPTYSDTNAPGPSVAEMEAQGQQFTPQVPESTYQADTNATEAPPTPQYMTPGEIKAQNARTPIGQFSGALIQDYTQSAANPTVQEGIAKGILNIPVVGPALQALGGASPAQAAGTDTAQPSVGVLGRAGQAAADVLHQINRSLSGSVGAAREMSNYTDANAEATARMNDLTHIPDRQDFETLGGIVSAGAQGFERGFKENAPGGYQTLIDERGKIDDGIRSLGIEPDSGAGRFIKAAAPIVLDIGGDVGNYAAAPIMDTAGLMFKPLGKVIPGAEKVFEATRSREAITHLQAEKAADVVSTLAEGTTLQQAASGIRAAAEDLQVLGRQDNVIGTALNAISSPDTPVIGKVIRNVEAVVGQNPARLNTEATKVRSVLETVEANKTAGADIAHTDLVAIAKGDLSSDSAALIPLRDQKTLTELNKPINGVRPLEKAVAAQAAAASNIERAVNVVADAEPIIGAELKAALAAVDLTDVSTAREALQPIVHAISTVSEKAATQIETYVDALVNHPLDAAATTYLRAFAEKNGYKLNPAGWQRAWGEFVTMQKQAFLSLDASYLLNNGLDMGTKAIVMEHALPAGLASTEAFAAGHGIRLPERVIGDVGSKAAEAGGHGSAAADIVRRTDKARGFERIPLFGSVVAKGRHLSSYVNDQPFIRGIWKKSVQRSMEAGLPRLAQRVEKIAQAHGVDTATETGKRFVTTLRDAILSAEGSAPAKILGKGRDFLASTAPTSVAAEVGQGPVAAFAEKLAAEVRAIPPGPNHEAAVKAVVGKYRQQVDAQGAEDAIRRTVGLNLQGKAIDFHAEMETAQRAFFDAVAAQDGPAAAKHANDVFTATRQALADVRNETGAKVKGLFQTHGLPQEEWTRAYAAITNDGYQHQIDALNHALEVLQTAGIKDVTAASPEGLRVVKKVQQGLIGKVREAQRMSSGIVDELTAARKAASGGKARDLSLNIDEEWNILDEWVAKQGQAANEAIDAAVPGTGFTVDRTAKTAWADAQKAKAAQDAEAQAAHAQVTDLFDRMEQAAADRASGAAVDPAEFAAQKLPMENALKAVVQARTNFGEYATVKGVRDADRTAFDYVSGKTNLDRVLDKVALFSMWQTRNPGYWVDAVVRNPAVGNVMLQYMTKTEAERNRRGLPVSYIGAFSLGKVPDDFPVLGGHEIFVNPFLPSFSILEQGVQVAKSYWASQSAQDRLTKAKAAGGDTTAAQGDYNNALTDFYSAIGGGISPNPILLDTATVFGLLGDRIIGNFGVAVPGSDIVRGVATLATGESNDLFKVTGLQNLVTQAQYKAIHQSPPLHGDKAYDISVMAALADMRTEGKITQAELYGAIEAKIRGDETNGALQGAMQLAGTENKYKAVASAAGLGAKTLRMPTAATAQYYGDKVARGNESVRSGSTEDIRGETAMLNNGGFYPPSTSPRSVTAHQATTYTDSEALARLSRIDAEYKASDNKRDFLKPTNFGTTPTELQERADYTAYRSWRAAQPAGTSTFLSDYVKAGMPGAGQAKAASIVQPASSAATTGAMTPSTGAVIQAKSSNLPSDPDQVILGYATGQIEGELSTVDRNRVEGRVGDALDERRKVFEGAAGTAGSALSDRLAKLDKPGRDAYLKAHAKDADVQALYAGYDAESAWVRTGSPAAVTYGRYATWSADQHYPDTADIKAGGGSGKIAEFVSDLQKGKVRDTATAHAVQPTFGAIEPATPAPGVAAPEGVDPYVQAARDKQVINEARIATSHSQPVADAVQAIYDAHTEAETKAAGFFKKVVEPALKGRGLLDTYNAETKAQDALVPALGVAATPQQTVALWYKAFKAEVSDAAKRGGLTYEQQTAGAEPTPEQFLEWIQRNRGQAGMAVLRKAGGAVAPSTPVGGSGGSTAGTPSAPTGPLQGPNLGNTADFRNRVNPATGEVGTQSPQGPARSAAFMDANGVSASPGTPSGLKADQGYAYADEFGGQAAPVITAKPGETVPPQQVYDTLVYYGWKPDEARQYAGAIAVKVADQAGGGGANAAVNPSAPFVTVGGTGDTAKVALPFAIQHEMQHVADYRGRGGPDIGPSSPPNAVNLDMVRRISQDDAYPEAQRAAKRLLGDQSLGTYNGNVQAPNPSADDQMHLGHYLANLVDFDYNKIPPYARAAIFGNIQGGMADAGAGRLASASQVDPTGSALVSTGQTQADTSSQAAFVASVLPAAQDAERRTGIPANIIVAIAAHESNYGRAGGNMLYGIKGPGATMSTYEVEGGKDVPQSASFRTYPSVEAATQDFTDLVTTGRYASAYAKFQQTGNADQFVRDLQSAGYATDPQWGGKIARFAQGTIDPLVQTASIGGGATMAARMPAQGPIVQGFGSTANVTGESHEGVDIQAAPGSAVSAPVSGTVIFAGLDDSGQNGGGGVKILGADGKYYSVWHVQPGAVQAGQKVQAGDQIGTVAGDGGRFQGNAVQPHVHFQISTQQNGGFVDPEKAVAGSLPQPQTGALQPRVPEPIRTQTPGQLQGGEPARTGTQNTPVNTTSNTTPIQTASGDMNGGVIDTSVTEPSKTGAILANSGTTTPTNPGFDANNYVGKKGAGFVSVVNGQEKSFVDQTAAENDFNGRRKTTGGPGGATPGFSPDDLVSPKISSGQTLKTILSSDADYETKKAQVELRLDAELERIRAKRDSAPGYDEYNSSPDKKGWAKAHPEAYKVIQDVFKYEAAAKADPANALAAKYTAAASDEFGRFPDTKFARDHFIENVLQGVSKSDGRAGNVTINLGPEKGDTSTAPKAAAGPHRGDAPTNKTPEASKPATRYDRAISPSGTYVLRKGAEPARTVTLSSMKDELSKAGYGGPWDDAAVLSAYERTTGGQLTSADGGTAIVAPSSNPVTAPTVTRPPVDLDAERKKIAALVPNTPAATRASDGALRGVWTKANSPLDFATWLKMFREEAGKPLSFQALASRLLSR